MFRVFKYQKGDIVQLNNIFIHPGSLEMINIGTIRKTKYRFNIFKETEYLICLSDNLSDYYGILYESWVKWIKESEIKKIQIERI